MHWEAAVHPAFAVHLSRPANCPAALLRILPASRSCAIRGARIHAGRVAVPVFSAGKIHCSANNPAPDFWKENLSAKDIPTVRTERLCRNVFAGRSANRRQNAESEPFCFRYGAADFLFSSAARRLCLPESRNTRRTKDIPGREDFPADRSLRRDPSDFV